jgi:hypothetical protein
MIMTFQFAFSRFPARCPRRFALSAAALIGLMLTLSAGGQVPTASPATPKAGTAATDPAKGMIPITSANLTDRAYTDTWPKPSFPATDREKKQFTVEFVYRYVQSDYTPAVVVPQIKHAEAQTDTPEHTFVSYISALKTLDYDWWLSLWDTKSQKIFRDEAANEKHDAAYWKSLWQTYFPGKQVTLESRIETVNDVMLEFRVGPQVPGKSGGLQPIVMHREEGRWVLTLELSNYPFLPWMGQSTITGTTDFTQLPAFTTNPVPPQIIQAQSLFFSQQPQGATSATDFVW